MFFFHRERILLLILYFMQVAYSFKTDSILDKDRVKGPNLMNK